ncbi:MarR family winged helix-turn-helix transcriptional regulator [Actinomycetospora corticicola]|uniref:DNA-binding MarR family transcriptional regulator n=1 Tax=Actinomycetospora corticicola TaxID=663602 RepID=A0A7Y9E0Z0_9PSEU|nr:MarR family transcriptional regulator [Actinomycetospora corticicola]NYD39131.1 DNA-binding MarR family transcriptional regulator [Actinomycetospora corticicola]
MTDEAADLRRAVQRLARRLRDERPRGPLTDVQRGILAQIMDHGPQTPASLARRAHTTPQALTRPLSTLVEAGVLERAPDPHDGRQHMLTISRSGWTLLREDAAPRDAWLAAALAELTEAEQGLLGLAARLLAGLAERPGAE